MGRSRRDGKRVCAMVFGLCECRWVGGGVGGCLKRFCLCVRLCT